MAVTVAFTWTGESVSGLIRHKAFDLGLCIDTFHCGIEKLAAIIRYLLLILVLAFFPANRWLQNGAKALLIQIECQIFEITATHYVLIVQLICFLVVIFCFTMAFRIDEFANGLFCLWHFERMFNNG